MTADPDDVTEPATTEGRAPAPVPDGAGGVDQVHHGRHLGWLALLVAVVIIAGAALVVRLVEPSEPGPFYTPPADTGDGEPGTLLRAERLETAPAGVRGWRILYRSTAPDGAPIAVSGTVFAPLPDAEPGSRRVVAWAHPTTGVDRRCAPSTGADGGARSIPGLTDLVGAGYIVTATDYPGLGTPGPHPYLIGVSEAHAVLDSIRAAHHLDGPAAGRSAAVWGHSQGGHAALFAGQVGPRYAPELELVGIAAAAPATDLAELLRRDIGGLSGNVLASMALVSWSETFPGEGFTLESVAAPAAVPLIERIADQCIETTAQELVDVPEAEVLRIRFLRADPWSTWPWDRKLAENTPTEAIRAPVLVAQGTADTIVWPAVTEAWVAARCEDGVVIDLRRYEGRTHTEIARASAADVRAWIDGRFAGRPAPSTCAGQT